MSAGSRPRGLRDHERSMLTWKIILRHNIFVEFYPVLVTGRRGWAPPRFPISSFFCYSVDLCLLRLPWLDLLYTSYVLYLQIIMKVPCLLCRRHLPLSCCFHLRIELLARLFFPELSQLRISMVSNSFSTIDCCCVSRVWSCMSIRKLVTLNSFTRLFYCLSGLMTSCLPHALSNNSVYLKLHSRMHHQPATWLVFSSCSFALQPCNVCPITIMFNSYSFILKIHILFHSIPISVILSLTCSSQHVD
jgi:hypothetical protein